MLIKHNHTHIHIHIPNCIHIHIQNVVPVGICQALTLALGNAAYLYLTVSFIQMLKAFTPVVVLAIGIIFKIEKAEPKVPKKKEARSC